MAAFPDGYRAYKSFTVRNTYIDEDLANVRLLVRIASDADIGALARPDGHDLRFTSGDGSTLIPYERVAFSVAGGQASAIYYLKPPLLYAASANHLRVYYGNPSAADGSSPSDTWGTTDYFGVWHFENNLLDSSGSAHHGTNYGSTDTAGYVGRGRVFGPNQYVSVGTDWIGGSMTIAAWVYTTHNSINYNYDDQCIVGKAAWGGDAMGDFVFKLRYNAGGPNRLIFLRNLNGWQYVQASDYSLPINTWKRVVASYDVATQQGAIYCDGAQLVTGNLGGAMTSNSGHQVCIGLQSIPSLMEPFRGTIDQVSIATTPVSAAAAKFDYHNHASADSEITWGDHVLLPPQFRRGLYLRSGSRGVAA